MSENRLVATCLLGLEGLVADELRRMDIKNVEPQNGRVLFSGNQSEIARANICSRYSERILIEMGSFRALSVTELFDNVKKLPWEQWIGKDDAFPVTGRTLNSKLSSIPDCQSIIKKAIVERLKTKYRISWFEESASSVKVKFLIMKDVASIMIDTSGVGLHKRGYRENAASAPIKETLAAAMADLSHIRPFSRVIDPFCGSGTILIESALKALNIAPGLRRRFIAEKWSCADQNAWRTERERAQDLIDRSAEFQAYGYDIDPQAIELTNENAKKAGVAARIHTEVRSIADFSSDLPKAAIICNPPYGERLLDIQQEQDIYRTMGEKFLKREGYSYCIISPDDKFEEIFGRPADKRRKLYNGMIKCQVYMYFKR